MAAEPRFYAGIGSRETPQEVMDYMTWAASELERQGLILRSGGAKRADTAFEMGIKDPNNMEIYVPWDGFNGRYVRYRGVGTVASQCYAEAEAIAEAHHPAWHNCTQGARKLHTRNVGQVLGARLDQPALFVLCWTPRGSGSGGTGMAIRIATSLGIPVLDLGKLAINEVEHAISELIQ